MDLIINWVECQKRDSNFDKSNYQLKHIIEQNIGHIKERRRIATRYETNIAITTKVRNGYYGTELAI